MGLYDISICRYYMFINFHKYGTQVIPCYSRASFMKKIRVPIGKNGKFHASFTTTEGFEFPCDFTNENGLTYISGDSWKEFARVYRLDVGQEITFSMVNSGVQTSLVTTGHLPFIHPSKVHSCSCCTTITASCTLGFKFNCVCYNIVAYYHLSNEKRQIIDNMNITGGTNINWRMMETVISQVMNLEMLVEHHDAGDYDQGRAFGFIHALTWSDCNKNFLVTNFLVLALVFCHLSTFFI